MQEFTDLKKQLSGYLSKEQLEIVTDAWQFAAEAHEGQLRASGVPYITHPVAVATILAKMHLDHESIVAALLHDVLEDTEVDKNILIGKFGSVITELVDGVSKLTHISFGSRAEAQAENFRKMILAMSRDIRVIIIKLADRLHNMRTLGSVSREKQRRKAVETLEIYAPIAHRLGMNAIYTEFEDLGFYYLYPIRYRELKQSVHKARGNRKEMIRTLLQNVQARIAQYQVGVVAVTGREKHLYSLYCKMREKDLSFSEIMDVYALRIIVKTLDDCYRLLGVVHGLYKPAHTRFKDYIAIPKSNGYQSLHTTLIGPYGIPIEIQIRTEEMDHTAERGIAAHWIYKNKKGVVNATDAKTKAWLENMLEMQETAGDSLEFIESAKVDLSPDTVYVFTPKGEILALPRGATPVDFAYAVHTDVGNACITAKINRHLAPLNSKLSSGETIEIVVADGAHPNPAWLDFVVTAKARSKIRHWLKHQRMQESVNLGKRLLEQALDSLEQKLTYISDAAIEALLNKLHLKNTEELYQEIGLGNQVALLIARGLLETGHVNNPLKQTQISIKGTEGMIIIYGKCCNPIPGDDIIGFSSSGRGFVVHRESCRNIAGMRRFPEKHLIIKWDDKVAGTFSAKISIETVNQQGILAAIARVVSRSNANIEDIKLDCSSGDHSSITLILLVKNKQQLAEIMKKIRAINAVYKVVRH